MKTTTIEAIGVIHTPFKQKFGIPRQGGRVDLATGTIEFLGEYQNPDYIRGIEEFSHLWLLFDFSEAHRDVQSPTVRPPRLGGNTRKGVFATRSPFRPNNIGMTCVKLISATDGVLTVSGVDLLDGTPIYDIKPYIPYTDSHPNAAASYADEQKGHHLDVVIATNDAMPEFIDLIKACIADDPRPSYQDDEREYTMQIYDIDTTFTVKNNTATIIGFKKVQ